MAVSIFGFPTPTPIPTTLLDTQAALGKIRAQNIANRYAPLLNQAKLTDQNLSNQYYPQISNAKLALLNSQSKAQEMENQNYPALTRAKLALINAQAERAKAPEQAAVKIINTPKGVFSYNPATGQTTPLNDAQGKQLMPLVRGGLSIAQTPGGGFTITEGGLQLDPATGQPVGASDNQNTSNLVTSPASPHSRMSNAGSTIIDTKTNKAVSVPTTQNVSRIQRTIAAEKGAVPSLNEIYGSVQGLMGFKNLPERWKEGIASAFGADEPRYRKYISTVKTLIPTVAEQLLNSFGLNTTTENRNATQEAITPSPNENPYVYAYRTAQTIGELQMKDKNFKDILAHGYALGATPDQMLHGFIEEAYTKLLEANKKGKTDTAGSQVGAADSQVLRRTSAVKIPNVKSKEEFQSWVKSLPQDQQEAVYQQLKANENKKGSK